MGVTKATHLISWSDALIQDYLAKLEILGSTVAPFLNLNGAHFGSLLSPERHFSSPYLGLQSPVSGEWVVDGYSSPRTLLNPSFALFSQHFSLKLRCDWLNYLMFLKVFISLLCLKKSMAEYPF